MGTLEGYHGPNVGWVVVPPATVALWPKDVHSDMDPDPGCSHN